VSFRSLCLRSLHKVWHRSSNYLCDDILLTDSNSAELLETKQYLKCLTNDMGRPKYFLSIEVAHQKHSILLSQQKYALDLLEEVGLLGCKPATTPIEGQCGFMV